MTENEIRDLVLSMLPPPGITGAEINKLIDAKLVSKEEIALQIVDALTPRLNALQSEQDVLLLIRTQITDLNLDRFVTNETFRGAISDIPVAPTDAEVALMIKRELIAGLGRISIYANTVDSDQPASIQVRPTATGINLVMDIPSGAHGNVGGVGDTGAPGDPGKNPTPWSILGWAGVPAGIMGMGTTAGFAWMLRRRRKQDDALLDAKVLGSTADALKGFRDDKADQVDLDKKANAEDLDKKLDVDQFATQFAKYAKRIQLHGKPLKELLRPSNGGGEPAGEPFRGDGNSPATTGVPVDETHAREYIQLAESQGNSAISTSLFGLIASEELANLRDSSQATDEERTFGRRFRARVDERFNTLMPTVSHATFARSVVAPATELARGYLDG